MVLASHVITAVLSLGMGWAFDILGRKPIILINFLLIATAVVIIPHTSPSLLWLGTCRVVIGLCAHFIINNPLILDYVCEESRGRVVVLHLEGDLIGQVIAITVLFKNTEDISPPISFGITGGVVVIVGIIIFFMLKEMKPELKTEA